MSTLTPKQQALAKLKQLRDEFAARQEIKNGDSPWQKMPKRYRVLLLTLAGIEEAKAGKAWYEFTDQERQEIGSLARGLAKVMNQYAGALR